jgi:hypothetical protein
MKNNKLMFDLTNTSTSEPLLAEGVFSAAILGAKTVDTFNQILNAKDKVKLGIHGFGNVLQSDSCSPTDQGAGALSEKEVSVEAIAVYFSLCQRTLEQSFLSNRMKAGSNNADFLPADFSAYIGEELAKKIASDLEVVAFQGDVTGATYPVPLADGLEKEMRLDADVVDVAGTAITAANVIAEMTKVYNAMSDEVLAKEDVAIYCSTNVIKAYKQALANASAEGFYNQKDLTLNFLEVELVQAYGMSANRMIATYKENLALMTDLVSDLSEIIIIPQLSISGKREIIVSGAFKFKTSYAIGTDIVYYS